MRSVVVLPQPEGPEQAGEFTLADLEGKIAQRRDRDAFRGPEGLFARYAP